MDQSRVESRQRCVTITICVHDHNCGTIISCLTITSCVYDHKLRVRSQIACVDPNREVVVIHPECHMMSQFAIKNRSPNNKILL